MAHLQATQTTRPTDHANAPAQTRRAAFTLVEMLVVVSIIALLMAILTPALNSARESTRYTICNNNLRQISTGMTGFAGEHGGILPLGYLWKVANNNWLWSKSSSRQYWLNLGLLYGNDYVVDQDSWRCPDFGDDTFQTSHIENWPPGPEGNPNENTTAQYSARPGPRTDEFDQWQWPSMPNPNKGVFWLPEDTDEAVDLPRTYKVASNGVVVADYFNANNAVINSRHNGEINIARLNGSATTVSDPNMLRRIVDIYDNNDTAQQLLYVGLWEGLDNIR